MVEDSKSQWCSDWGLTNKHSSQPSKRKSRGQALVEFALLLPLLIMLVFGAVDLGRAFYALITITNAARVGARYGVVNEIANILVSNTCACSHDASCAIDNNIKNWVIREADDSGIFINSSDIDIVCPEGPYKNKPLRVSVNYHFDLIMDLGIFPTDIVLSRAVEMRLP